MPTKCPLSRKFRHRFGKKSPNSTNVCNFIWKLIYKATNQNYYWKLKEHFWKFDDDLYLPLSKGLRVCARTFQSLPGKSFIAAFKGLLETLQPSLIAFKGSKLDPPVAQPYSQTERATELGSLESNLFDSFFRVERIFLADDIWAAEFSL